MGGKGERGLKGGTGDREARERGAALGRRLETRSAGLASSLLSGGTLGEATQIWWLQLGQWCCQENELPAWAQGLGPSYGRDDSPLTLGPCISVHPSTHPPISFSLIYALLTVHGLMSLGSSYRKDSHPDSQDILFPPFKVYFFKNEKHRLSDPMRGCPSRGDRPGQGGKGLGKANKTHFLEA